MSRISRECDDVNPKIVKRSIACRSGSRYTIGLCDICKTDSFYTDFISEVPVQ